MTIVVFVFIIIVTSMMSVLISMITYTFMTKHLTRFVKFPVKQEPYSWNGVVKEKVSK